jgi:single-strand DNA-binding protein
MSGETIVTIVGNAVADPELRYTQSGAAVVSFTVASTPRKFDKASGQWEDGQSLYMRCTAWRQHAENIAESVKRGQRLIVQGRLEQRSYDTKEGEKRTVIELQVEEVGAAMRYSIVNSRKAEREGGNSGSQYSQAAPAEDPWGSEPAKAAADAPPF